MQRILNYGSSLQAYSLRRLLQRAAPEADVGFVDYRPGEPLVPVAESGPRVLTKVREYARIEASVADRLRFLNHKRSYARRYFPLVGVQPEPSYTTDLDVQVIGSDEVFNCVQSNANVGYSRDLFGHGSSARRLVSYAGSFGNTSIEKIEDAGIASELTADLARFDHLSVRDANSAAVVEALTGRRPELHVDPALAYDLMNVESRVPTGTVEPSPFLLVYAYPGRLSRQENAALRDFASRRGLKVVCLGGAQSCGDVYVDCDPFTLLAYFRDAEVVVSDTFHGTIFSIINERPFATITRRSHGHGYGNLEKLGYLLDIFGLRSREMVDVAAVVDVVTPGIDWAPVRARIEEERARSAAYLGQVAAT